MRLFPVKRPQAGDPALSWTKSSLSYANGNCVEVAGLAGDVIWVRNSRTPRGYVLAFTTAEWDAFVGGVRNGEFDREQRSGIVDLHCGRPGSRGVILSVFPVS